MINAFYDRVEHDDLLSLWRLQKVGAPPDTSESGTLET